MSKHHKFIFERKYTIPNSVLYFRDWEDFGPKNLPEYFDKGYQIFCKRLQEFSKLERTLEAQEERELTFMLDSLIHAKNAAFENKKSPQ